MQRWQSMRSSGYSYFKATPKSAALGFLFGVLPIGILAYAIHWERVNMTSIKLSNKISSDKYFHIKPKS